MKSKERPWVLTKEIPTYEVNKDHEGLKAQKEEKKERKSKKEEDPNLGHERDPYPPGSRSFKGKPKRS